MRWFGWGLLLLTGAMFVAEYVIYGFVTPEITSLKMAVPIVAAVMIVLSHTREKELYEEHLPH
jgi:peptidoglycan/LPS O-acetylase OafA/YrhL